VGAENAVTLCDLRIFVDHAAEPVPAQNAHIGHFDRRIRAPVGRLLLQRPVRTVRIVMIGVLAKDQAQVPFAGDQHPVQALAAGTALCRAKTCSWALNWRFALATLLSGIR
jgi:hypothetical protein